MPPQQNENQTPEPADYGFINEPGQEQKPTFFDGSVKSLVIMIGGTLFIIILLFLIYQAFKPPSLEPKVIALVAEQQEIIRVTGDQGRKLSTSQETAGLAASINTVIWSQKNKLVGLLTVSGVALTSEQIATDKDPRTDQKLAQAADSGQFDPIFTAGIIDKLSTYQSHLKSLYGLAKKENLKSQLATDFDEVTTLLEQANDTDASIPRDSYSPDSSN